MNGPWNAGRCRIGDVHRWWLVTGLSAACLTSQPGCKPPTWGELMGQKPAETVQQQPVEVVAPTPVTPPPPPPKPKPEEVIARFKELKTYEIDDGALASITSLEEGTEAITELNLNGSKATNAGLANLEKLVALKSLDVRSSAIDKDAVSSIAKVSSLEELRFDGVELDAAALSQLLPLQNLRVLVISGCRVDPPGLVPLTQLPMLEELRIEASSVTDAHMQVIGTMRNLKHLLIDRVSVTDQGISMLGGLDNLVWLQLGSCQVHGESLAVLGKANFKRLNVSGNPINERGAAQIARMGDLEFLGISELSGIQDKHVALMTKGMKGLKRLDIENNPNLTPMALAGVKGKDDLEELKMGGCTLMNDQAFVQLKGCKNLKLLTVDRTSCTISGALALKKILPDLKIEGLPLPPQ
jgi:Leucine-rich repeat (LRR) protein